MANNITNKDLQQNVFQEGGTHDAAPVTYRPLRPVLPISAVVTPAATLPQNSVASTNSKLSSSIVAPSDAVNETVFRGVWKNFITYNVNDVVIFNGSTYLAILTNSNAQPDLNHDTGIAEGSQNGSAVWTLISENLIFNPSTAQVLTVGGFGPFDKTIGATATSSTATATLTPSATGEIAVFQVCVNGGASITSITAGWNLLYSASGGQVFYYKILSDASSVSVSASLSASVEWAATLTFFKFGGFISSNITATSENVAGNTVTVTCTNSFAPGNIVLMSGLTNATWLNGNILTVVTATGSQFTAAFAHATYGTTLDTGTATRTIMQATTQSSGSTGLGPITKTFSNPTSPNSVYALALFVDGNFNGLTGGSDTDGNTYHLATAGGASTTATAIFSNPVTVSGTTPTISGTLSGNCTSASWYALELAGSSQATQYQPYDVEQFRGSVFVCLFETTSDAFGAPANWALIGPSTGHVAIKDLIAQSAAQSAVQLYAVPVSASGMYRITWDAKVTTPATTSCVLGGTTGFQIVYTDADDSVVVTTPAWWGGGNNGSAPTSASANTTQNQLSGEIIVNAKASTNITFSFGYTSVGGTAMQYSLHVKVEVM